MLIFFYLVSSRHLIQGVKECLYHLLSEWESKTLNFIIDVYIQANRPAPAASRHLSWSVCAHLCFCGYSLVIWDKEMSDYK